MIQHFIEVISATLLVNTLLEINKIKTNFSYLFSENLLRLFIGFFLSVWMARYLGPESYGKFSYVITLVGLFLPLYILGSDEVITKFLVKKEEEANEIMGTGLAIKLLGSFLSMLIINTLAYALRQDEPYLRLGIVVYSLAMSFQAFGVINNYYQSRVEESKTSLIRNLVLFPVSVLKVVFIITQQSWEYFVWLSCLEVSAAGLLYVWLFTKENYSIFRWKFSVNLWKKLLSFCIPFFVVLFLEQALFKVDQLMIGEILGDKVLGEYGAANKLINLWNFVPIAFLTSLYPSLVSSFPDSKRKYRKTRRLLLGGLFWFSLIFAASVTFLGEYIVNFLYGEDYRLTGELLRIYSWVTLLSYFTIARGKLFLIEGRRLKNIFLMAFTFVANFILNLSMIPKFGATGAIYATLISLFLGVALLIVTKSDRELLGDFLLSIIETPKLLIDKLR